MCQIQKLSSHIIDSLQSQRDPFNYNYHNRINSEVRGLYAFWLGSRCCLYVGRSTDIQDRMYGHIMQEHNPCLDKYFKAFPHDIEVSYVTLCGWSVAKLEHYEGELIKVLRAFCKRCTQKDIITGGLKSWRLHFLQCMETLGKLNTG